jgi:KEOPS complex subunit Pcc1
MRAEFILSNEEPQIIYDSLKVEGMKAKIYLDKPQLIIELEADSVTELRAAINGWLRLIKMCEKILEVLK